jgi:hypothetical protein
MEIWGAKFPYLFIRPEMHMPSRTAKFMSAIFASFLASSPLTTTSSSAAGAAADDCLSAPKGETPAGRHWYYRIDHPSNRHCWYLREEGGKLAQSAPSNSSPSNSSPANSSPAPTPISPKPEPAMQRSVSDAHAELSAQWPVDQPNRLNALSPALSADTPVVTQSAEPQRSVVASRWPGSSDADPVINPAPAKDDPDTSANASPQAPPPPVLAASQYAAADLSSETPPYYSLRMQLVALTAALALAGIVGSIIFKLGTARRPAAGRVRARRGAIWEPTDDDSIVLSAPPEARAHHRGFARDLDRADDPGDRIAEFFSQLSKRART